MPAASTRKGDRHREKPIAVRPGPELRAWLDKTAKRTGVSRHALINRAISNERARQQGQSS